MSGHLAPTGAGGPACPQCGGPRVNPHAALCADCIRGLEGGLTTTTLGAPSADEATVRTASA